LTEALNKESRELNLPGFRVFKPLGIESGFKIMKQTGGTYGAQIEIVFAINTKLRWS
jgi:hypothetical protein